MSIVFGLCGIWQRGCNITSAPLPLCRKSFTKKGLHVYRNVAKVILGLWEATLNYVDCRLHVNCMSIVLIVFELCRSQGFYKTLNMPNLYQHTSHSGERGYAMLSHKWHWHNSRPRPFLTNWSTNIYPWYWHKKRSRPQKRPFLDNNCGTRVLLPRPFVPVPRIYIGWPMG